MSHAPAHAILPLAGPLPGAGIGPQWLSQRSRNAPAPGVRLFPPPRLRQTPPAQAFPSPGRAPGSQTTRASLPGRATSLLPLIAVDTLIARPCSSLGIWRSGRERRYFSGRTSATTSPAWTRSPGGSPTLGALTAPRFLPGQYDRLTLFCWLRTTSRRAATLAEGRGGVDSPVGERLESPSHRLPRSLGVPSHDDRALMGRSL